MSTESQSPPQSVPPARLLLLLTRTPLHVGAGASVGAIDQPVVRERPTGFPVIPGTSLKGVLRDAVTRSNRLARERLTAIFGDGFGNGSEKFEAGRVSFGEGRLLAFPVRSATGAFAFITCPLALERLRREHPGPFASLATLDEPKPGTCLAGGTVTFAPGAGAAGVVLEEYRFARSADFPADWEGALLGLVDDTVWKVGRGRWVLLGNGDFGHFVRTACEVSQHVGIDPKTGTAKTGALFNLEAVPAESLFFAPLTPLARATSELDDLAVFFGDHKVLQLGGDGTTGLGFCSVTLR